MIINIILSKIKSIPPCAGGCLSSESHCILQITVEDVMVAVRKPLSSIKNS